MKPYVFKNGKSKFWQLRIFHEGKCLAQMSLKTEHEESAWVLAMVNTLAYEMSTKPRAPKAHLRRVMRELYTCATTDEWPMLSIREYLDDWKSTRRLFVGGSTEANQITAIRHFETFMDENLELLLDQLKPLHARQFAGYLVTKADHSPVSANKRLESVYTVFQDAVDDNLIPSNPFKGITVKVRKSVNDSEITSYHPFSRKQIETMIQNGIGPGLNPEMTVISLVALDLGGRSGDMFGLLRKNFTLADNLVLYHVRKVVKLHGVILFPCTVALLREYFDYHLLDKRPEAPLAPTFAVPNDDTVDDDEFRFAAGNTGGYYGRYLHAVGIRSEKPPRVINGHADWDHSFHSFRPTVSSALKLAGVPTEAVMARMPHKSEEVSRKYNRFTVHNVCQRVFEGVGLPVPQDVKQNASLTIQEIFELIEMGRKRLVEFRGKLDLHDGSVFWGQKACRADLIHKDEWVHPSARRGKAKKASKNLSLA